ncbi:hypothetical protein AKO1_013980 [Acrasis kona]|uniref:Copine C-terminal domain-containing protein n=1 Tax=Acrasis kona TaxID=1008807 RepID=A0AAW2Z3Y2_9EUKA
MFATRVIRPPDTINKDVYVNLYFAMSGVMLFKSGVTVFEDQVPIGATEMIENQTYPQFVNSVRVRYRFEKKQVLQFRISDENPLDYTQCTLASIINSVGVVSLPLNNKERKNVLLHIRWEKVASLKGEISLRPRVELPPKGILKTKPLTEVELVIKRELSDGTRQLVNRSKLTPGLVLSFASEQISGDNENAPLHFEVFKATRTKPIGALITCLNSLSTKHNTSCRLTNSKSNRIKNKGTLFLDKIEYKRHFPFVDYVSCGHHINIMYAIDFSTYNGIHHELKDDSLNCYQKAIKSIGSILDAYDNDHLVPSVWIRRPSASILSSLGLLTPSLYVKGVDGIMDAYKHALSIVKPNNVNNLAKVISTAAGYARSGGTSRYQVCLVLTAGSVDDMTQTVDQIVKASGLPLSVIIVGIGNGNFTNMRILDGDAKTLQSKGKDATRDIIQFVPFLSEYSNNLEELNRLVLEEVPKQFCSYMNLKKIVPRAPQKFHFKDVLVSNGATIGVDVDFKY